MTQQRIGPREQQLRAQREQQAVEADTKAKPGRPRVKPKKPDHKKDWRKQLSASNANAKRKDRRT